MTLLYVDHHDQAYAWAENRVFKFDERSKSWKVVKFKEEVVVVRTQVEAPPEAKRPFKSFTEDVLADCGISPGDYEVVRQATEDSVFNLGLHVSVLEALMDRLSPAVAEPVAFSAKDSISEPVHVAEAAPAPTFEAFDNSQLVESTPKPQEVIPPIVIGTVVRVNSQEQLEAVLSGTWEKWQIFLHPAQQELVDAHYNGPVRISGSAGTGKTIVALHRVNHLLRISDDTRILLATISPALASFLHARLRKLLADKPRLGERVEVCSVDDYAQRLYQVHIGAFQLATRSQVTEWIAEACKATGDAKLKPLFLLNEWDDVIDAQQITSLEQYQGAERIGRKVRLSVERKSALWAIFSQIWVKLQAGSLLTQAGLYHRLNGVLEKLPMSPVEHVVVDECQDLNQGQVRFLSVLTRGRPNALFLSGDIGQRIFQQPFSWRSQGIDLRGRTKVLRMNYRTSQQIRKTADRLLEKSIVDADGERVDRDKTLSAFGGAYPTVATFDSSEDEVAAVAKFLQDRTAEGVKPHEMAIMFRDSGQLSRAEQAAKQAGLATVVLDQRLATLAGSVNLSTMHLAKGLEFRAVAVMACDDDVIPSPTRLAGISDPGDMHQAYDLERHLLYVACTRARDHLMISGVNPASEFLADLK
jgi:superfamily I DNA/RNA helicase